VTALLTTSAQRAYRACPRLYSLRYERGYRPLHASDPLAFGTLGHRGLEAWWLAAAAAPADPDSWWGAALTALDSEVDDYQRARAQALMWGYHCRWHDMTWQGSPIRVLGVESEFCGPLANPDTGAPSKTWLRAGKLDVLVDVGGRVFVVEHKTTSENIDPGGDYWARLMMDPQVSNYVVGARLLGHPSVDGVIYDVIRKTSLRPLAATPEEKRRYTKPTKTEPTPRLYAGQRATDETADEYYTRLVEELLGDEGEALTTNYARALVVRLESEEREAAADLWQTGVQIRDARRLRVWPRNPDACLRWGRKCEFFGVCSGVESLDDPTRFRVAENPHEELNFTRQPSAAAE